MYIQLNINTEIEINSLTDLPKLKLLTESSHMKINKSQLAREFGVDRRTIDVFCKQEVEKIAKKSLELCQPSVLL